MFETAATWAAMRETGAQMQVYRWRNATVVYLATTK